MRWSFPKSQPTVGSQGGLRIFGGNLEVPFWLSFKRSRYSQKNHCNDNCNDFSDYNDIIAPLNKLIMLHYIVKLESGDLN